MTRVFYISGAMSQLGISEGMRTMIHPPGLQTIEISTAEVLV